MKSVLAIVAPIVLVMLLAGIVYMYKTGMIEGTRAQTDAPTETVTSLPEDEGPAGKAQKVSAVDSSKVDGLSQARDIARASLETRKREELDMQHRENRETRRKKRLKKSIDGWLKRTD